MDKLKAIRFFLKLSETLSFKGTAAYFGVPASTVSRSLKALEEELGVSLVERTTRRIRLTEAGEWYRAEVAAPVRALAAADEMASTQSQAPKGIVRITALMGYGELKLFPILKEFQKQYPQIICDIELTDRYVDLSTGDFDIAIRVTADPPDYLVAKRLHSNQWALLASPEYIQENGCPKTYSDIVKHKSLGYRGPRGVMPWLAAQPTGEVSTISRQLSFITNHGIEILNAALNGEGLAYLPFWGVSEYVQEGRLEVISLDDAKVVFTTGPEMSMYLLYGPKKARLGKVRAAVDFLREHLTVSDDSISGASD